MFLSEREKTNIIEYLTNNTNYSIDYLRGIKNHSQLFSMYKRIKERMHKYPIEIIEYYNNHPEIYVRPTDEEIKKMSYNELAELRKYLGIKKLTKKVVKTEQAEAVAKKAHKVLEEKSITELATEIIISNTNYEREHDFEHESFLTKEEIAMMYPGEELSADELADLGIIVTPSFGEEWPKTSKKKF